MNYKKAENSAKMKARKRSVYGPFWRSRWDSNPRALADKRFSRPPRYDHFDTAPGFCYSIVCNPEISFWGHIWGHIQRFQHRTNPQSAYFIGFLSFSPNEVNRISRPPRYDHFDTAPYAVQVYRTAISIQKSVRNFNQELKLTCPGHRNLYIRSRSCPYRRFCRSA